MEARIRKHVATLLSKAPKNRTTLELRQELHSNLLDKFHDLKQKGATDEEAFDIVKSSVGDIDQLLKTERSQKEMHQEYEEMKRKKALLNSLAAILFIASPAVLILLAANGFGVAGVVALFAFIAAGAALNIYSKNAYTYEKLDDTMVEEFREWKANKKGSDAKKGAYSSIMWTIVICLYFIISFATMAWYITWVIFIIGAAVDKIIALQFLERESQS